MSLDNLAVPDAIEHVPSGKMRIVVTDEETGKVIADLVSEVAIVGVVLTEERNNDQAPWFITFTGKPEYVALLLSSIQERIISYFAQLYGSINGKPKRIIRD